MGNVVIQVRNLITSGVKGFDDLYFNRKEIAEKNKQSPLEKPTAKRPPASTQMIKVFRYNVNTDDAQWVETNKSITNVNDKLDVLTKKEFLALPGNKIHDELDWKHFTKGKSDGDTIVLPQLILPSLSGDDFPDLFIHLEELLTSKFPNA